MGTVGWVILIVVVLVIAAAAAYALMGNRGAQARREQAAHLRDEAAEKAAAVEASRRQAQEADARAEVARAEAERAEQEAARSRDAVSYEEARVEDRVRTADGLDPDVDTRAADYRPTEPTTAPETGGGVAYADPAHRADTERSATDERTEEPADPAEPVEPVEPAEPHEHQHVHRRDSR
jgi:hypothetical protein